MSRSRRWLGALVTAVLLGVAAATTAPGPAGAQSGGDPLPMIFVHGFMGSGQQFEAQALRFASNGYPDELIEMFEHDSLAYPGSQADVWARLDTLIADLKAEHGVDQVFLLGHSQGTGLSQGYLTSTPERAASVARYVNLDGAQAAAPPGGVETLAVWGEGAPTRQIAGAENVQFADQSHTEVVNSTETFGAIYEFLTGEEPEHHEIVRQPADEIEVSGRAIYFPQNTGATNGRLEIYEVDGTTGERLDDEPEATYTPTGDGSWGPFQADGDAYYEFALRRDERTHHIFVQRFVRSSRWVRLLTSEPGGLADSFWGFSDDHVNLAITRNKEWWGDQGDAGDTLSVNGTPILTPAISPRGNRTIGIFVHDAELDRQTNLDGPVTPTGLPFLTGVDLFIPADMPPSGTVAVEAEPRLGDGPETVCIPNYASANDRISIQFNSYHHLLDESGAPAEGHAAPDCGAAPPAPPAPPDPPTPPPAVPVPGTPDYTG
jgi:pimeloyl-ACP methyl ester carboxylesterase